MRRVNMMICSVLHLPESERTEIEALIATAPRDPETGRLHVRHPALTIEACRTGYWISTDILTHPVNGGEVHPDLWDLLQIAGRALSPWILFDYDVELDPGLPIF